MAERYLRVAVLFFFEEGLVQMGAILFYVCVFFYVGVSC